uniref:Ammonium transporter n=1 Tax=Triparma pacifica TaxID=91992 RepID=A0A7S2QUY7_9STRA
MLFLIMSYCEAATTLDELKACITVSETAKATAFANYDTSNTNFWLMFGAILVFFMQCGFAMLEVGMVNIKNTKNILIKNVFDASIGAICWWAFGWGFSNSTPTHGNNWSVIGDDNFFLNGISSTEDPAGNGSKAAWLFQWAFAATAATIVSGAVAERVTFGCYIVYSVVLTSFIYPVVVHWGWNTYGWASAWRESELLFDCGVTDFAGSGVVHLCGAVAALVGAKVVGPRIGRFDEGIKLPQQSVVFQTLGTLILWMGWYGFNGASTLAIGTSTGDLSGAAAHTMVTTTLSAASCCLTTVAITALMSKDKVIDIGAANNGILAGLVSITAGCSSVECYAAILIGIIGAFWYVAGCAFLEKLKIDDVVGAVPVHGFCGIWGVLAPGLFASELQYSAAYYSARAAKCAGIFEGGDGSMLAANVVFIIAVILWVGITSTLLFLGCKMTIGVRVFLEVEENGMDDSKHGGKVFSATPVPTQEV